MDSSRSEWCDQNHSITLPTGLTFPTDSISVPVMSIQLVFVLPAHQAEQAAGRDLGAR